jgi:hypothetical protein
VILQHALVGGPLYQVAHVDGILYGGLMAEIGKEIDVQVYDNSEGNYQKKDEKNKKLRADGIGNFPNPSKHVRSSQHLSFYQLVAIPPEKQGDGK